MIIYRVLRCVSVFDVDECIGDYDTRSNCDQALCQDLRKIAPASLQLLVVLCVDRNTSLGFLLATFFVLILY